jgi:hypothetical protein
MKKRESDSFLVVYMFKALIQIMRIAYDPIAEITNQGPNKWELS